MRKTTSKSLYLFLCSILGMVLFSMLHRAVFVLYDLLLLVDYNTYSFGMPPQRLSALDLFTMVIAIFLGGWYGIMLGLEWYAMVYGPNVERPAGLFHAFKPHHWRKTVSSSQSQRPVAAARVSPEATTTVKVPVTSHEWNFDELLAKPSAKKAVRKTPRKVASKTTVTKSKTVRHAKVAAAQTE